MHAAPYTILFIVPALLAIGLALYGLQRERRIGAVPFSLLMFSLAIWCFCHAASVASTDLEHTLLWSQAQYAGIVAVGPFWLLFALSYADRDRWATTPLRVAMASVAVLTYAAVLTNNVHGLWWSTVRFDLERPYGSLAVVRGPLFWAHAVLTYSYLLVGISLFIHRALGSSRFYQRQARLVIAGALFPLVGNLVLLAGVRFELVDDPTPFLLLVSGVLLFYASSRYQLLDLAPIAQRAVFESMPDGVIVIDTRGIVTAANESARQFLPHAVSELVGQAIAELLNDSPLAIDVSHMLSVYARPQSRRVNYALADGLHGVELRLQPLYERAGVQAGTLLVLRDMTEQACAEHARDQHLREVSLLHQIARSANSVVNTDAVLRAISDEMLRSMAWNRIVIGLLQPDTTTLRLIADQQLNVTPTLEGRFIDAHVFGSIDDLLSAGQPHVLYRSDARVAGTMFETVMQRMHMETVLLVPLSSRSETLGALFLGSSEERLVAPEELHLFETIGTLIGDTIARTQLYDAAQEASQLKSAFLATVSHELRTPLTSIIGFADMLKGELFGPMPAASDEAISYIQRGSQVLLRLINDILDFSKMEAGHFGVDLYPVDVGLVVDMVVSGLRPQIQAHGLTLKVALPAYLPMVQANSTRLEQVLTNLVANAIKFTESGAITISAAEHDTKVRLSVQDTGIGVAPEFRDAIFDAFRQAENPLTRRYGGTGLGLAISKRLIELMGGTITLESEPGVGSTFHCDLHAAALEALRERAVAMTEERGHATSHSTA